jgi:hypothetical protein
MTNDPSDLPRLAYERASWLLEYQRARVTETRSNSSILIVATALVASFLGKWSLDKGEGTLATLGLVAFALGILCGIAPMWPIIVLPTAGMTGLLSRIVPDRVRHRLLNAGPVWDRGPGAKDILAMSDQESAAALTTLAIKFTECAEVNERILRRRTKWLIACKLCLAAQVLLWIANALAST